MCIYLHTSLFSDSGTAHVIFFVTINIRKIIIIVLVKKKFSLAQKCIAEKNIWKVCLWYVFALKQIWSFQACFGNDSVLKFWCLSFETQVWTDIEEHIRLHPRWLLSLLLGIARIAILKTSHLIAPNITYNWCSQKSRIHLSWLIWAHCKYNYYLFISD